MTGTVDATGLDGGHVTLTPDVNRNIPPAAGS
jgi:hypothetical protein